MSRRSRVFAVAYAVVRVPVTVVDRAVVQQLPAGSRRRTVFDHGLGVADHWAGLLVGNDAVAHSGRARIEHAGRFTGRVTDLAPGRVVQNPARSSKPYASTKPYARTKPHTGTRSASR